MVSHKKQSNKNELSTSENKKYQTMQNLTAIKKHYHKNKI